MMKFYDHAIQVWYLLFLILIIFIPLELPSGVQGFLLSTLFILLISYNYTKKNIYFYQRKHEDNSFDRYVRKRITDLRVVSFFVLLFVVISLTECIGQVTKNSVCIGLLAITNIEMVKKFYTQILYKGYYLENRE